MLGCRGSGGRCIKGVVHRMVLNWVILHSDRIIIACKIELLSCFVHNLSKYFMIGKSYFFLCTGNSPNTNVYNRMIYE